MKIATLKVEEYKGCKVYVRHFEGTQTFEYLFVYKNEIYTAHIEVTKKPFQRKYKDKELVGAVKTMLSMAETTIETLLDPQVNKTINK